MQEELLQLWADTRFTLMFVTHSISEAIKIGNRILLLSPHPGEVVAELNSAPADSDAPDWPVRLERKINTMLFGGAHADEDAHD
jgi:NitT/TauT family transport system ATP-binding protein